jgi:hypothetical protein
VGVGCELVVGGWVGGGGCLVAGEGYSIGVVILVGAGLGVRGGGGGVYKPDCLDECVDCSLVMSDVWGRYGGRQLR